MKAQNLVLALFVALISSIQSLSARSIAHHTRSTKHPAGSTAQSNGSAATEPFAGAYRAVPKTSIARNGTTLAPVTDYSDLHSLLVTLPKDAAVRSKYPGLRKGVQPGPTQREPEEIKNVRIKSCWLASAKHERQLVNGVSKGDNDFHVIVTNSPTDFSEVMNAEISGLPAKTGSDFNKLRDVRALFLSFFTSTPSSISFARINPPKHVTLEGSLYFDGDHNAGGKTDPGPAWAKPQSVWEIHPIYKITSLN